MNSSLHAKQAPSTDFGVLAIRTIGGECPEWAAGFPPLTGTPTVEILIVREAAPDFATKLSSGAATGANAPWLMLVVDDALPPENFISDGAIWAISATARDLDIIAEAFLRLVCGPLMIGVDLADALDVAGGHAFVPHFGRGAVVEGLYGDVVQCDLENALRLFAETKFDDGVFILQSISEADDEQFDLVKSDELFTSLLGESRARPALVTSYCGASASAVIAISFKKPATGAGTER
ncbi:hypothetical protein [uncultured Rhodoblastus sp.]|uniref:hypothetical protein n=1 Tax=uncultured Rhodoblastus sp. TaxID=543037 RepID=UPI0025F5F08E|nr:hypothetical protein [uncultured Rhodoblastus sp.]